MKFDDIENAFLYTNASFGYDSFALINKKTGEIIYSADLEELDKDQQEEYYANNDWISAPDKNDLDLGQRLVFDFVASNLPDDYERIREMFRQRGAYRQFKDLLSIRDKLQEWYDFENERQKNALLEWCKEKGIELDE